MASGDGLLVRIRPHGGVLPVRTARAVAEASRLCGNGLIDLSGRANLQLRGVSDGTLRALTDRLSELGLLDDDPDVESVRNVLGSPLAGLDPTALLDIRPLLGALERRLADDRALHALPGKFGFAVGDGGWPSLDSVSADIRFDAVAHAGGPLMRVGVGGTASSARPLGLCRPEDLPETAARLSLAFLARRGTDPDAPRRVRDAIPAAAAPPEPAEPKPDAPIGPFRVGGLPVLAIGAPFGRLTADGLAAIASAAEGARVAELRLTPWRSILLPAPDRIDALLRAVSSVAVVHPDDPRLAITTCTGAPGCERGTTPTHADALRLASPARDLARSGIDVHLSGCAKGCAHPQRSRVTLVGRAGRYDLVLDGTASDEPAASELTPDSAAILFAKLAGLTGSAGRLAP